MKKKDKPTDKDSKCRIIDLDPTKCHWPFDNGWYCGAPVEHGVYCRTHGAISYRADVKRERGYKA